MKTATLGTVSQGTLRPEDLISAFVTELRNLRGALPRDINQLVREYHAYQKRDRDYHLEDELLEVLMDRLEEYAPPFAYFGPHQGNGADYGFWISETALEDFDGLKVSDTSEVPADYNGAVLHRSDHGNLSLYWARKGNLREVWAIV